MAASEDPPPKRSSSESSIRSLFGIDSSFDSNPSQRQVHKSGHKSDTSPQKHLNSSGSASLSARASKGQELMARLHKEEKIRDAASAMLTDLNHGPGILPQGPGPNILKQSNQFMRQLTNLNSLKLPSGDSQQRKRIRAQLETADREVQEIQRQLRELGLDEDDEISSGDEDGPSAMGSSLFMLDDDSLVEEDPLSLFGPNSSYGLPGNTQANGAGAGAPANNVPHPLTMLSSSAASSSTDVASSTNMSHNPFSAILLKDSDYVEPMSPFPGSSNEIHSPHGSSEDLMTQLVMRLESLDSRSPESNQVIEQLTEFVHSNPPLRPELRANGPWILATEKIQPFLLDRDPAIRCLGFKILRLLTVDVQAFIYFRYHLWLELHFTQVLSKDDHDKNHDLRLNVIQLIRLIINIPGGSVELSQGVYRALVAVAEQTYDVTRHICIETLAELLVIDPERVFEAGAVQILLKALIDPGEEPSTQTTSSSSEASPRSTAFSSALAMALTDAADKPAVRREYLRDGRDLSSLLNNFTDVQLYGIVKPNKDMLRTSAAVMQVMFRSWVGLGCFDFALFVECMTLPVEDIQATLLDVLDFSLWVPSLQPQPYKNSDVSSATNASMLSYQFTAILLHRLHQHGLQEKLVSLQTDGETEVIRQRAQKLGAKVFTLSARVVPSHAVVQRSMALSAKMTEEFAKAPAQSLPTTSIALFGTEAKLQATTASWAPKPRISTFVRYGLAMDDSSFKKLVNATHILETKLFRQWNWDALMELVQGPLRSPKRMEELTRGSKLLKRLVSFYRPFKYRFSNLAITKEHIRYVEVGKEMVKSLLVTPGGAKYLAQNKLFRQIAECLAQLDPLSGIMSNEPLFSVRRFRSTLCCAYAELIGVLSRSTTGHRILAQIRIFNMLYRVCDINREDVMRSFICALDYRLDGHPRHILAKALTASTRSTRLFATEFMGAQLASSEPCYWALDLMVEQLWDVELVVAKAAAVGLYQMCSTSRDALDYFISTKTFLGHLGDSSEQLRILFMGRPQGFEALTSDLESRDMSHWAPRYREMYVDKIEAYLESVNGEADTQGTNPAQVEPFKFPTYSRPFKRQNKKAEPPSHFYGEMALTDQGCRFLQNHAMITELTTEIEKVANAVTTDWTPQELRRIHGALWAIGHVASRSKGALMLDMKVTQNICDICRDANIFTLQGTAYYTLGLFALSAPGAELLHQCGWDVVYDVFGKPMGVVLPPPSYYARNTRPSLPMRFSEHGRYGMSERDRDAHSEPYVLSGYSRRSVTDPYGTVGKSPTKNMTTRLTLKTSPLKSVRKPSTTPGSIFYDFPEEGATTKQEGAGMVVAPSNSTQSLISPTSGRVMAEVDSDAPHTSRSSSCVDLLEFPQRRDETLDSVLSSISQLGSSILSQSATKRLVTMRASYPRLFERDDLIKEVIHILASGHFKQVTRRFIFELLGVYSVIERFYKRTRPV